MKRLQQLGLTWKLWSSLQESMHLPTRYWRHLVTGRSLYTGRRREEARFLQIVGWLVAMLFFVILLAVPGGVRYLCLSPVLLVLAGTYCSTIIAMRVSAAIANEHERGRYELISLAPVGSPGLDWRICNEVFQDSMTIRQIIEFVGFVTGLMMVFSGLSVGMALFFSDDFATIMPLVVLPLGLYFDVIQSTVIGFLIGMLVPTFAQERISARTTALGFTLTLAFLFYLTFGLLAFGVLPLIYNAPGILPGFILPLLQLLLFYALREGVITALWLLLAWQLGTDVRELKWVSEQKI